MQQQQSQQNTIGEVIVNSSSVGERENSLVSTQLSAVTVPVTAEPFDMPSYVTDATLNKLADVLSSLLTDDILSCYTGQPRKQQSASTAAAIVTPVRRRKTSRENDDDDEREVMTSGGTLTTTSTTTLTTLTSAIDNDDYLDENDGGVNGD